MMLSAIYLLYSRETAELMTQYSGNFLFAVGAILVLTGFSFLDIFINDILPKQYSVMCIYNRRHLVFMGMALASFGVSAVLISEDVVGASMFRLWLDGGIATSMAILDIFSRHGGSKCQSGTR